jgi:hypothetical protein
MEEEPEKEDDSALDEEDVADDEVSEEADEVSTLVVETLGELLEDGDEDSAEDEAADETSLDGDEAWDEVDVAPTVHEARINAAAAKAETPKIFFIFYPFMDFIA